MKAMLLMPFKDEFNNVHEAIKDAVADCALHFSKCDESVSRAKQLATISPDRVDYGHGAAVILSDLKRRIMDAEVCIVDLSGVNENVVWEFGFVHALDKSSIVLTQNVDELTFDLRQFRVLEYNKDDLKQTLRRPLKDALIDVLQQAPERFGFPDNFSHAQTLAMSTASPAYFLDANFRIRFMNQAAKALFFSGQEQPIEDLVGKSLAEFIVSLQASIGNLAQVERNLYLQSELLQSSNRPSPCNFEEIQFRSKRYGDLKLSKAGVAVRHPATGEILGWVVSFNIAEFGSQSSSAAYHKHHASVVENEIFAVPTGTAVPPETRTRSEDITWNEVACSSIPTEWQKSYSFRLAEGYSEKKKCFDYAITLMLKDRRRYGLTSVRHLPESFFDFERTEYLIVDHSEGILGVCRITLDYDVSEFTGSSAVLRQVSELSSTKSFADVGAYFNTSIKGPQRRILVGKCLGAVMHISERNKCPYQYVQVPTPLRQVFRSFGFVEVGDSFRCTGWGDFRWVPMLTSPFWITGKTQPPSTGGGTIDVNDREYVEIVLGSYNSPESLLTNWEP